MEIGRERVRGGQREGRKIKNVNFRLNLLNENSIIY